jgi:hypothetical protein
MVIDGTWFSRTKCFLVYWDRDLKHVQWWRYTTGELSYEITEDLLKLKEAGVIAASVTSDGAKGTKRAVDFIYPSIPHQRCIVHLKRYTSILVTKNPKTLCGQEVRPLILAVTKIETVKQRDEWITRFNQWSKKWDDFLKERSYLRGTNKWWYTHKYLRRIRTHIRNAIPNLFFFLEDPTIPKDTNGLEGRFSALKQHYSQHRGLSKSRRAAYLFWYTTVVINRASKPK